MQILYSNISQKLALEIADFCRIPAKEALVQKFSSGEYLCKLNNKLPTQTTVVCIIKTNDDLMECLSIVDAAKRAGSSEITLVAPYIAYGRQNIMQEPYSSVGMEIMAKILNNTGINKLITIDIHSYDSLEFFNIKTHHISIREIINYYEKELLENIDIVVAPDKGSQNRIGSLNVPTIFLTKQRTHKGIIMSLDFDVENKRCLIVDDIFDSGNTLKAAYDILMYRKASRVKAYVTHFLGQHLLEQNTNIPLYTTNSVDYSYPKILKTLSLAPLIARIL